MGKIIKIIAVVISVILIGFLIKKAISLNVEGSWQVIELSESPMSILGYGDMVLEHNSHVEIREDDKIYFFRTKESDPEIYPYEIDDSELVIWYSDFGVPLKIKEIDSDKIELSLTGMGNSIEEQKKMIRIKLKKIEDAK